MLQPLDYDVGVYVDDSALAARGKYVAADQMRFVRGRAQTRYGNEKFSTTALTGIARGIHAWADNSKSRYLAVGTHLRLYALDQNGIPYDITPIASYGFLVNPFTTDGTTAVISVTHTAHGLVANQAVSWPFLTTTVNGATITATTKYAVTVVDANTYTFTADSVSTSAGTPAVSPDYRYYLAPGQQDGLDGAGFGTGGFGSGGYSSANNGLTLFPRSWSWAFWGQNLIANARGAGIFEWAPNTTASELLTNNAFSTGGGGFTANGAGWSIGGGIAQGSATNSSLTQSVTMSKGAWHLLHIVTSVTSGSFIAVINSVTIGGAPLSTTQRFNQAYFNGGTASQVLSIIPSAFTGNITLTSLKVMTDAQQILPSAPTTATCVMSTSERILVACGVNDSSGNFDPMRVAWSDQQNNQSWTAAASNLAGGNILTNGSRIVGCLPANGENLIWTDTCMYALRFVPNPSVVYDLLEIGPGAGLIGANAVCVANGIVYWKGPNGQDYLYNGGPPTPISSNTMRRDFNDNLAWVQQDKIFSASISAWNEIQHLYPDSRDGVECSRYNKYNFAEDCWDPGLTTFTCWLDQGIFQFPISVDTSGYVRYCEKGMSVDGAAFSWTIQGAKIAQGTGQKNLTINGFQLDAAGLMGGYQVSFLATWKDVRGVHTKTFGPFNANNQSGTISARVKGEFLQPTWSNTTSSPTFWRAGADLFDMQNSGDQR